MTVTVIAVAFMCTTPPLPLFAAGWQCCRVESVHQHQRSCEISQFPYVSAEFDLTRADSDRGEERRRPTCRRRREAKAKSRERHSSLWVGGTPSSLYGVPPPALPPDSVFDSPFREHTRRSDHWDRDEGSGSRTFWHDLRTLAPSIARCSRVAFVVPDLRENGPEVKCRRQSSTSLKGQVDGIV